MRNVLLVVLGVAFFAAVFSNPAPAASPSAIPAPPRFDGSRFRNSTQIDNVSFPLSPGTTFVYEGTPKGRGEHDEVEVTAETKTILGVRSVVVHDRVWAKGVLEEDTFDWYAQDDAGNVWYMGEDATQYKGGAVIGHEGSWEAGRDGAQPGWVMEAHPSVGDVYRQEYLPGVAEDVAEVESLTESVSVPYGAWTGNVLRTRESSPLEPSKIESKLYAPRVGLVMEDGVKGGTGGSVLVEIRH